MQYYIKNGKKKELQILHNELILLFNFTQRKNF